MAAQAEGAANAPEPVLHPAKVWFMHPGDGLCIVSAQLEDGLILQLVHQGGLSFAVGDADGRKLRKGRTGEVRTDEGNFAFTPDYLEPSYLVADVQFSEAQIALLRSTRNLGIFIDGKVLAQAGFEEADGYPEVINDVAACAAGKPGWWNAPAED